MLSLTHCTMKVIAEKVTVHPVDIPFHLYNDVCVMKKPACVSGIKTLNRYFTLKPRDEIEQDLLIEIMSENETSLTNKTQSKICVDDVSQRTLFG